jgi:hypothetical protein
VNSYDVERLDELVDAVFVWSDRLPTETLEIVARALMLDHRGPLAGVGAAIDYFAGSREHGQLTLARIKWRYELRKLALNPGGFVDRLEGAEEPPWPAVRAALVELAET